MLIFAGLAVAYMLIPIFVIAAVLVRRRRRRASSTSPGDGFTLEYWQNAFAVEPVNDSMVTSLELAALATLISTAIGTLMAMALVRYEFFGRRATNLLIVLPMATPEIVIGAALLSMFIYSTASTSASQTLLIAHVMFCISFVVVVVRSRLIGFDRSLEEAAADLGATPARRPSALVTLPLIAARGSSPAALLAFALSIDDFVISNFNSGTTVTFPLYIFGASLRGIPVQVNVLATMMFAVTWSRSIAGALAAAPGRADVGSACRRESQLAA